MPEQIDAYTIQEFCSRHHISRSMYYKLRDAGKAPLEMRVGAKVLISVEAAADWRAASETDTLLEKLLDEYDASLENPPERLNLTDDQLAAIEKRLEELFRNENPEPST